MLTRRTLWLVLALASSAVLLTARLLVPAPAWLGTHEQLGLPPCGFLALFGVPCPACGLTTSFAHMARLDVMAALHAHPVGPLLFVICALLVPLSLRAFRRNWSLVELIDRTHADAFALWVTVALLGCWAARLLARAA